VSVIDRMRARSRALIWLIAVFLLIAATLALLELPGAAPRAHSRAARPSPASSPGGNAPESAPGSAGSAEPTQNAGRARLPSVFFGNVVVTGRVLDEAREAVADAEVHCTPSGFTPEYDRAQVERFLARTGTEGEFAFQDLPGADAYQFNAFSGPRLAELKVSGQEIEKVRVELIVREISYERFGFFDESGHPLDIRGGRTPCGRGDVLWNSELGECRELRWVEALGLDARSLQPNEFVNVYRDSSIPRSHAHRGARADAYTVRVPGYAEVQLAPQRRPARDWPKGTRVALARSAEQREVRFDVAFPDLGSLTEEWRDSAGADVPLPEIALVVRDLSRQTFSFVNPRYPVFYAVAESEFAISAYSPAAPALEYTVAERNGTLQIRPSYPPFALVTLGREQTPRAPASGDLVVWTSLGGSRIFGTSLFPGKFVFAPLPIGEYTFELGRLDPGGGAPIATGESLGPVRLEPGVNDLDWR